MEGRAVPVPLAEGVPKGQGLSREGVMKRAFYCRTFPGRGCGPHTTLNLQHTKYALVSKENRASVGPNAHAALPAR